MKYFKPGETSGPPQEWQCRRLPLYNQRTPWSRQYAHSVSTDTAQLKDDAISVDHAEIVHEMPDHLRLAGSRERTFNPATSKFNISGFKSAGWITTAWENITKVNESKKTEEFWMSMTRTSRTFDLKVTLAEHFSAMSRMIQLSGTLLGTKSLIFQPPLS